MSARAPLLASLLVTAIVSCTGAPRQAAPFAPPDAARDAAGGLRRIQHIIVVIHENRSFDNLFATFPGADGATSGKLSNGKTIRLIKVDFLYPYDLGHGYQAFLKDYDGGKMDGFDLEGGGKGQGPAGRHPYQYVDPAQIAPYWQI